MFRSCGGGGEAPGQRDGEAAGAGHGEEEGQGDGHGVSTWLLDVSGWVALRSCVSCAVWCKPLLCMAGQSCRTLATPVLQVWCQLADAALLLWQM
jgi:hypothetical protein